MMAGSINRTFGTLFGATYALVGIVGFAVTGGVDFAASEGRDLILLELNPLHNVIHLGIGIALFSAAAAGVRAARRMNGLIGGTYLLVGVLGLFLTNSVANIIAVNHPDNVLHLITAIAAIVVATRNETTIGRTSRPVGDAVSH